MTQYVNMFKPETCPHFSHLPKERLDIKSSSVTLGDVVFLPKAHIFYKLNLLCFGPNMSTKFYTALHQYKNSCRQSFPRVAQHYLM